MYFEEEGSVSVADERQLLGKDVQVGDSVLVKSGRYTYPASVEAIGKDFPRLHYSY